MIRDFFFFERTPRKSPTEESAKNGETKKTRGSGAVAAAAAVAVAVVVVVVVVVWSSIWTHIESILNMRDSIWVRMDSIRVHGTREVLA